MNAAAQAKLAADVGKAIDNVVPIKSASPVRPNAEQLGDYHRRQAANCSQRIAESKRRLKTETAAFATARKLEKARHEAEMAALAETEAFAKEQIAQSIADDERLVRYNRAAIDALAAE